MQRGQLFDKGKSMSLMDSILSFFGKKAPAPAAGVNNRTASGSAGRVKPSKQVYDSRPVPLPEWAQGLNATDLVEQLPKHVVCRYTPNFGAKKIMSAIQGPDGNLIPEYDGIAGDCGAVKNFGSKIAKRDGMLMPYRYVDLNMAFKACCDNPKKCPFYMSAEGEAEAMNSKLKQI